MLNTTSPDTDTSAPKERPAGGGLAGAIKTVAAKNSAIKVFAGGAAPQERGDPNNIKVGVRCRPAVFGGVALTRTQMARLAQNEGAPHPHMLRQARGTPGADAATIGL